MVFEQQRIAMVDGQLRTNKIIAPNLIDLFLTTAREAFAPTGLEGAAYVDEDMDLGHGRVLLEPLVAARLLQAADPSPGDTALVIGGGNGYMPRLLCDLGCQVTVVEPVEVLAEQGRACVPEATWLMQDFATLPSGPYDLILVCGGISDIPMDWSAHVTEGGQILAPLSGQRGNDGRLVAAMRVNGILSSRTLANAAVPDLPEFTAAPMFQF